jgi:hypothetical protein
MTGSSKTTQQQLEGKRDLRFHDLGAAHPRRLTLAQIDSFNKNGYLKGFTVLEGRRVDMNRHYFDGLLKMVQAAGLDSYAINGWQHCCVGLYDLCTHPVIVEYISDLLGPNVICLGAHYFCKLPHDSKQVSWHQDAAYWPLSPSKTITAWLAVDNVDRGNAALRVIPGTHTIGALTTELSAKDEANVLSEKVPDAEKFGDPVYLELKAGQISIHSDLLLHGSTANDSDRRRCGVAIRFCAPDVRDVGGQGWNSKSIWALGEDAEGYWGNCPRPQGDSVPDGL